MKVLKQWCDEQDGSVQSIEVDLNHTLYEYWNMGHIGNFGSFQTTILQAYQIADSGNRERLEQAFPMWFVEKS